MWKVLKELVRGEPTGTKEINNIDFEILDKKIECSSADKLNMYYTYITKYSKYSRIYRRYKYRCEQKKYLCYRG